MRRAIAAGLVLFVVLIGMVFLRGQGFTSRRSPWPLEERLARAARGFLIPPAVRSTTNPVSDDPAIIRAGLEHFADHCASCHGNDGSGDTSLGRAFFPRVPDMRRDPTQAMTDGELFYVIERGIPFTGMPAWGAGTPEGDRLSWELVRFIRRLPDLSAEELREMELLNPRSPAEERRRKEIEDFLSG